MNKIRVVNNKIIPLDNDNISVIDNVISFKYDSEYIIEYIDCDNIAFEIVVPDSISAKIFEYSNNGNICINNKYSVFGKLICSKFYCNLNTDEIINIYLKHDNASIEYYFSSIGNGIDKYVIDIYHMNRNTSSDIFNRTVAKEGSSNSFDINSYVENEVNDTYLNQHTKIVTLGNSNNRINPNMFIGEASTNGIHSSTIGSISDEDIFYLMSRGIDYETSINLIIKGMILSNINPNMEYKEKILSILNDLEVK